MVKKIDKIYEDGKKSLETLLREKAYEEVKDQLQVKGIEIEDISDEDIESLVAAKVNDMMNGIKGFGIGSAFAFALSMFLGA